MPTTVVSLDEFRAFVRDNSLGVLATHSQNRGAQAALVSFGVTDSGELVVDTQASSRKADNLATDPRVAAVIGTSDVSIQVECIARIVSGDERAAYQRSYVEQFPDSAVEDEDFLLVVLRPHWLRYYDSRPAEPRIVQGRQVWMR